jgi:mannose-1-phosphate guanylyltransferase/mannose-6-phosphate isomerase
MKKGVLKHPFFFIMTAVDLLANMKMIVPVILSGGSGTRLWPLSRNSYPKQLLPLVSQQTMLQDTVARASDIPDAANPIVICNDVHRFLVAEQLQEIALKQPTIILEPVAKNTAPAVAIAALHALSQGQDPLLLIMPADHVIKKPLAFQQAVKQAQEVAEQGFLVTFGINPVRAETGYGYIKKSEKLENLHGYRVERFVEKPDSITAQTYLESGEYLWNSGMFMFRASVFLKEMEKHSFDILENCREVYCGMTKDLDFLRLGKEKFSACRSDSIDYAVMEKSQTVAVVALDAEWSDVGSWDALWEVKDADVNGNVVHGDAYLKNVTNSYIHSENRMLAVVGVSDHVVVETADAVLVVHKDHCQDVKAIVGLLKNKNRTETDLHRRVYRPWGYYEVLDGAGEFQVKRIMVKSGARLSLQSHKHRSEHWVVISGTAIVTRGEEILELTVNQSTYIPIGAKHRLENRSAEPLVIIEVQCGDYVGEDDIVRYEDQYGRHDCVVDEVKVTEVV